MDLYVKGPDGEYVSCCIVWHDEGNRMGIFEPVCRHAGFRRRGFGRAVVMEGIRRVAVLDGEKVQVDSGQRFYETIPRTDAATAGADVTGEQAEG